MDFDITIVGGGLVGASLALALKESDLSIALVEARKHEEISEGWDSRIYAISPGSVDFLDSGGSWGKMDHSRVSPVREMRIYGDDGASELRFSAEDVGMPALAWIVESRNMLNSMMKECSAQENLEIISPARCTGILWDEKRIELDLEEGAIHSGLLVGADGARSWLRAQAGFETSPRPYRQTAIVANFVAEKPHRDIAWQWFRKDGILAYLPIPGNRISIVWSVWTEKADALLAEPHDRFVELVAAESGHALGDLEMITPPAGFPLRLMRLDSMVKPRIALVGDAAHNTHPLAGQGVNLGFRDARELSSVLLQRGMQKDCGDYHLLRRFDRARREDILSMQTTTDVLQKLFNNDFSMLSMLRNTGLRMVDGQGWLKNALIRHALA
ncbi:MAG: UbiH/UbiF family hydroxylase [Burkholderiales bacterium]|nr:UbiH/UbiF family hydroxylase [Burkholderiales bacterium]